VDARGAATFVVGDGPDVTRDVFEVKVEDVSFLSVSPSKRSSNCCSKLRTRRRSSGVGAGSSWAGIDDAASARAVADGANADINAATVDSNGTGDLNMADNAAGLMDDNDIGDDILLFPPVDDIVDEVKEECDAFAITMAITSATLGMDDDDGADEDNNDDDDDNEEESAAMPANVCRLRRNRSSSSLSGFISIA
jgi:hypothetical protein